MRSPALALQGLLVAFAALAGTPPQSVPKDEDFKRYRKQLEPGAAVEPRLEAMKNVAFYDSTPMAKLLVDALAATLKKVEELEAKRADVDTKIDRILKGGIEKAGKGGAPSYAGVEELQVQQRAIGEKITAEERVVRGFVEALGSLKSGPSLDVLLAPCPKKPARLRATLLDALGKVDNGKVAEYLIVQLEDPALDVRLAAAASLLAQRPEFVPASAFAPLLRGGDWQERALAIDALAKVGDRTALDLLVAQTAKEEGRMLADLGARLEQLTGQKFGKTTHAWIAWWQENKEKFQPKGIDITQPMHVARTDGKYASFWGVAFDSLRVVYVVDISGSMQAAVDDFENLKPAPGRSRMELARREVKASINGLPPDATFNVMAYSDVVLSWGEQNVPATPENKRKAFEWLDGLGAVGQTNIYDALEAAFRIAPPSLNMRPTTGAAPGKLVTTSADTILFLSDGGPTCGRTTDCEEILKQVREWNETRRIQIHAVGVGKQVVQVFMKRLAEENGGQFVLVEK